MEPTQPVFCAGSRKHSNSHSYSQYKDRNSFKFQVSSFRFHVSSSRSAFWVKHESRNCFIHMSDNQSLNIAVIGGGPGGYAAAFLAADLGMTVTLIDPELNPGGVCLYRGCIPSKALLHVAKLLDESHQAKDWGIEFAAPKIDLVRLRSWKESVVKKLQGGLGQLSKQRSVQYIQGRAGFENSNTLRISKADGADQTVS